MSVRPPINIHCFRTPPGEIVKEGSETATNRRDFKPVWTIDEHVAALREAGHADVRYARGLAWLWDGEMYVDWVSDLWPPDDPRKKQIEERHRERLAEIEEGREPDE